MSNTDNFEEVSQSDPVKGPAAKIVPPTRTRGVASPPITDSAKTMKAADELEPYFDITPENLNARTKQVHSEIQDSHNKVSDLTGKEKKVLDINKLLDGISSLGAKFAGYGGRMAPVPSRPMSGSQVKKNLELEQELSDNPDKNEGLDKAFGANVIRSDQPISEAEEEARQGYNKTLKSQWRRRKGALKSASTLRIVGPSFQAHEEAHQTAEAQGQGHIAVCGNSDCHEERQALQSIGERPSMGHYMAHHVTEGSLIHRTLTASHDAIEAANPEPEDVDADTFRTKARYQHYSRLYQIAAMASRKGSKITPSHVRRYIGDKVHRTMDIGGKRVRVGQAEDSDADWHWDAGNTSVVEASKGVFDVLKAGRALSDPELRAKKEAEINPKKRNAKNKIAKMDDYVNAANSVIDSIHRFVDTHIKKKSKLQTGAEANDVVARTLSGHGETRARGTNGNELSANLADNGDQTAEDSGTATGVTALVPKARVGLTRKATSRDTIPAGASRRDIAKKAAADKAKNRAKNKAAAEKRRAAKKKSSEAPPTES